MVTVAPGVHKYWDDGLFVLNPLGVSSDGKVLTAQFFWLCPGHIERLDINTSLLPNDQNEDFIVEPPTLPSNLRQGGRTSLNNLTPNIRLYNCATDAIITSGQLVTVSTSDPVSMPLPSMEILQLHWLLHRVLALCAAAGYFGYQGSDDDSEGGREDELLILTDPVEELLEKASLSNPWVKLGFIPSLEWLEVAAES